MSSLSWFDMWLFSFGLLEDSLVGEAVERVSSVFRFHQAVRRCKLHSERSKGSAPGTEPGCGEGGLSSLGALVGSSQEGLGLAELSQVQGSNLLGLLDLLLIGPDLTLHLVNQSLHPLMVLLVFVRSKPM